MTEMTLRNTQGLCFSNFIFLQNNIELLSRTLRAHPSLHRPSLKQQFRVFWTSTSNCAHVQSEGLGVTVRHFCYFWFRSFNFNFIIYIYISIIQLPHWGQMSAWELPLLVKSLLSPDNFCWATVLWILPNLLPLGVFCSLTLLRVSLRVSSLTTHVFICCFFISCFGLECRFSLRDATWKQDSRSGKRTFTCSAR